MERIFFDSHDELKDYNRVQNELVDEISYEDKLKFTQKIKYLNQDQLTNIIQTIVNESSEAFKDVYFFVENILYNIKHIRMIKSDVKLL